MELDKLEDVLGLRFQHAFNLGASQVPGSENDYVGSAVVNKYNLLLRWRGGTVYFHNMAKVINDQRTGPETLVSKLGLEEYITSVKYYNSPFDYKREDCKATTHVDDLLLIETPGKIYVHDLLKATHLRAYDKKTTDRKQNISYHLLTTAERVFLVVVEDRSIFTHEIGGEHSTRTTKLPDGQSLKLVSNVLGNSFLLLTDSNGIYRVTVPEEANTLEVHKLLLTDADNVLKGDYSIIGCHLQENLVLLGVLLPESNDNAILFCNFNGPERTELRVAGHCLNELYLLTDSFSHEEDENADSSEKDARIDIKYLKDWNVFLVHSNKSTSALIIASNPKLINLNSSDGHRAENSDGSDAASWRILLMSEGYNLESDDFDNFIADLFIYTNYKNEIYRKNSLEDTPTMKDPAIVLLLLQSGVLSFFYADNGYINSENAEVQVLPPLYRPDQDSNHFLTGVKTEKTGPTQHKPAEKREPKVRTKELSEMDENELIDHYYKAGYDFYKKDRKSFKLHEALANSLQYFNNSLVGPDHDPDVRGIDDGKLNDYLIIMKKLFKIQDKISDNLDNSRSGEADPLTSKPEPEKKSPVNEDLINKLFQFHLINNNATIDTQLDPDDIGEVEEVMLHINTSLHALESKFANTEKEFRTQYNRILCDKIRTEDPVSNGVNGHDPTEPTSTLSIIESKLNSLIDNIASLYSDPLPAPKPPTETNRVLKYNNYPSLFKGETSGLALEQKGGQAKSTSNFGLNSFGNLQTGGVFGKESGISQGLSSDTSDIELKDSLTTSPSPLGSGSTSVTLKTGFKDTSVSLTQERNDRQDTSTVAERKESGQPEGKTSVFNVSDITTNSQSIFTTGISAETKPPASPITSPFTLKPASTSSLFGGNQGQSLFGSSSTGQSVFGGSGILGSGSSQGTTDVKFGFTTSKLSGYNLASVDTNTTSVFSSFNTNKSLLDIAMNTNQGSTTFPSFPASSNFSFPTSSSLAPGTSTLFPSSGTTFPAPSGTFTGFTGANNFSSNSFPVDASLFGAATLAPAADAAGASKLDSNLWSSSRRSNPLD